MVCPGASALGEVDGASALLEPCLEAVAAGDGRELWQFEAAGAIQSAVGKKCLQARPGVKRLPPKRTLGSRGQRVPLSVQPRIVLGVDGRGAAQDVARAGALRVDSFSLSAPPAPAGPLATATRA